MTHRSLELALVSILVVGLAAPAHPQAAPEKKPLNSAKKIATQPVALTERQRALHALNRLTFGPRPGDVEAVLNKGLDSWMEDQLHPESIDDSALNPRLGPFATTRLNSKQIAAAFPSDGVIRQIIAFKRQIPDDPVSKLVYSVNVARIQQQDLSEGNGLERGGQLLSAASARLHECRAECIRGFPHAAGSSASDRRQTA